jgi:hypothetical protein
VRESVDNPERERSARRGESKWGIMLSPFIPVSMTATTTEEASVQ